MNTTSPTIELNLLERVGKGVIDQLGRILPAVRSWPLTDPAYPNSAVLLDIPGVCQVSSYTCGVTSTWSIITALGCRLSLKEWYRRCHKAGCHPDEGMDIDQIRKALKPLRMKVLTRRYRGRAQVARLIDAGQPILFGQGGDLFDGGDHWMYIYGCSPRSVFVGNAVNLPCIIRTKEAWTWRRFEKEELNPKELYLINQ